MSEATPQHTSDNDREEMEAAKVSFRPYLTVEVNDDGAVISVDWDWADTCQGEIDPIHGTGSMTGTPAELAACAFIDEHLAAIEATTSDYPAEPRS